MKTFFSHSQTSENEKITKFLSFFPTNDPNVSAKKEQLPATRGSFASGSIGVLRWRMNTHVGLEAGMQLSQEAGLVGQCEDALLDHRAFHVIVLDYDVFL